MNTAPRTIRLCLLLLGLTWFAGCDLIFDIPHPSDHKLVSNFQQHEGDFEKLVKMAREDANLSRIAHNFTWLVNSVAWPRPEAELGFSRERWDEYRRLFRKLDLESGLVNSQPKSVSFIASSKGLAVSGSSKGYLYSTTEPLAPVVEVLDNFDFRTVQSKAVFKRLKEHWYLFYEVD